MHIPDGFLNLPTAAGTFLLSGAAAAVSAKKIKSEVQEEKIPLYGVTAALIFAAQMVNFPIINGTSGHLIGGLLAALIAGPFGGFLIMASVLIVQALLFADGGISALGANIFNMAFIGSLVIYYVYRFFYRVLKNNSLAIFISAWLSVVLSAAACAIELWLSGRASLSVVITAMVGIHALIGIGEGLITFGVVQAIKSVKADILQFYALKGGGTDA